MNNLYGAAMCQKLPISDYKLLDDEYIKKNIDLDFIENYQEDNSEFGYILMCDIKYPK